MSEKTSHAATVTLACASALDCKQVSTLPAYEDRLEVDPAKRIKPVQVHPYICLGCWRLGWRSFGPLDNGAWRIYQET